MTGSVLWNECTRYIKCQNMSQQLNKYQSFIEPGHVEPDLCSLHNTKLKTQEKQYILYIYTNTTQQQSLRPFRLTIHSPDAQAQGCVTCHIACRQAERKELHNSGKGKTNIKKEPLKERRTQCDTTFPVRRRSLGARPADWGPTTIHRATEAAARGADRESERPRERRSRAQRCSHF